MSIKVLSQVWEHSKASGTALLVLLCLADYSNDEGECWPSISSVAKKARLKDDRHVKRVIHEQLETELGEVQVIIGGGVSSRKGGLRSNRYRITVHMPVDNEDLIVADRPPSSGADSGSPATQIVADRPPLIVADRPPEPSGEPSMNRERGGMRRRSPIPADFAISDDDRQWAQENFAAYDVDAETAKFIDNAKGKGLTSVDWSATWRGWMRKCPQYGNPTRYVGLGLDAPIDPEAELDRLVTAIPDKYAHVPDHCLKVIEETFSDDSVRRQRAVAYLNQLRKAG